ncbi:YopX family protein [Enterococcus diestrammenae]|uniref:YopX protein domain-containing protein n=1 Tax=Enterococcus diestrammenae TaxID=1155073 RepID=A0ABV0F5I2_9ENTE|nr:YopX family protein [Enterococcus diestrammenae]KAF1300045.1 hypothetical protein BAU18_13080 [Enterococcus diestrammenae]
MIPKFRSWVENIRHPEFSFMQYAPEFNGEINKIFENDGEIQHGVKVSYMQSTGLKDKNGVEIYVGDIVRHSHIVTDISIVRFGEFGVPNMEEQSYQDCAVGFYYENASEFKDIEPFNMTMPLNSDYVKDVLVNGNIYANPELLNNL